jgi:putative ATP-dependent endonuclease of OLD family
MLGKGAIVVEGLTEFNALPVVARKMEEANEDLQPLDIAGVAFFDAESEGQMPKFGNFFKSLGLRTFGFYDLAARSAQKKQELVDAYDIDCEHQYAGFEALVVAEVPVDRQWAFLEDLRETGDCGNFVIAAARPGDDAVRDLVKSALKGHKGAGWAARLLDGCEVHELPVTVTGFLTPIYAAFPKPVEVAGIAEPAEAVPPAEPGAPA